MNGPFILTVACLALPWEPLSLLSCCLPVSRGGFQSPHGYLFVVCPCRSLWGLSDIRAPCSLLAITATHQAHVTPIFAHLQQRHGKDEDRLQVAMCGFSPVCQAREALNTNILQGPEAAPTCLAEFLPDTLEAV